MLFSLLFFLAVFASLLSQLPLVLSSGVDGYFKLVWLAPLGYAILKNANLFGSNTLRFFYLFFIIFFLYCFCLDSFIYSEKGYMGQDCYNIAVAFMVMTVSFVYWYQLKEEDKKTVLIYISRGIFIGIIVLSLVVYLDYLRGADLRGRLYIFQEKNSMGQILLSGLYIGLSLSFPKNRIFQIIYCIIGLIVIFIIFALKSRATLVGIGFLIIYYIIFYNNKKMRMIFTVLLAGIIIYGFIFSSWGEFVYDNFILAGRSANDINDLSSGRFGIIERKLGWVENDFIGIGNTYLDCFPLAIFVQYGIIGCLIIGIFLLWLTIKLFKLNREKKLYETTVVLYLVFMVNCFFEAYPPFGPGVKCFMLWLFIGFSLSQYYKYNNTLKSNEHKELFG